MQLLVLLTTSYNLMVMLALILILMIILFFLLTCQTSPYLKLMTSSLFQQSTLQMLWSIFLKFYDLAEKLKNTRIDGAQISETWQDIKNNDHNQKIDKLEKQYGFKWYSYARPKFRDNGSLTGGGGSAILVNSRNWLSHHLDDISLPQGLEVVWVEISPKHYCQLKMLIICGIYSKPNSHKKTALSAQDEVSRI